MNPSVDEVFDLVVRLIGSDWPTTADERDVWFAAFGLPDGEWPVPEGKYPRDVPMPRWPGVTFGCHSFQGEFVGVHWFLWKDLPVEQVHEAAIDLRNRFVAWAGAPGEQITAIARHPLGFTAWWQIHGRTIDMYFHQGNDQLPDGTISNMPVVQLHVDHSERSQRAEEWAAAQQERKAGRVGHRSD